MRLALTVNGEAVEREIAPSALVLDFVRDDLGLTGAKRSCEVQVCGTCTLLLDGQPISACCFLAADAAGRDLLTIEGLRERPDFARLERAFLDHAALQCGFCTPGMLLTVSALLAQDELTSEQEIKQSLAGNLCRCTGYRGIVEAVAELAGVTA